ncbi:MAG: hypothetical protein JXR94_02605 [Candidatus Hydrogenedentes bacterium]|nr:hypothetical protein [Candidatus Hydrogenedentota bacterium]
MRQIGVVIAALAFAAAAQGAAAQEAAAQEAAAQGAAQGWTLEQAAVVEGFLVPECLCPDPESGAVYVSNVEAAEDEYWNDDGKGFVSRMTATGEIEALRWLDTDPLAVLNGPKGLCILKGNLYIADNGRLLRCPIKEKGPVAEVPLPRTGKLNDLATDGEFLYVSDTELGLVYKVGPTGSQTIIQAPPSVNGVTCFRGRLFAVGWDTHEVYELDPSGDNPPVPFGVAEHFTNLDGIEVLADGTFIVSDFMGNQVCSIAPDRKTVQVLVQLESPADIGIDRTRGLLYVPQFMLNKAVIYKLLRP